MMFYSVVLKDVDRVNFGRDGMDSSEMQVLGRRLSESFALMPKEPDNERVIDPTSPDDTSRREMKRNNINNLEAAINQYIAEGGDEFSSSHESEYLRHHFIEGVYARELLIPAGTVVVGKLHKYPRICIISGGECTFVTEYGTRRVTAPFSEVMQPGTKTAVYAHRDTTWTAIHATHETDLDRLEQIFIAKDHDDYRRFLEEN